MNQEQAIAIGQQVLIWLSSRPEAMQAFLATSGASASDLRRGAQDAEFLGFLLEHLLQSDALVLAFAEEAGLSPSDPGRARAALPGGYAPDWT